MGSFIVCSPCNFCPPHVYCAFSVGKVKKKQKKKQLCRSYKIKSRSGVKTGAVMPRPVPPARLSKRPKRKVNPFALQSRQISKNRRPPIKQTMKRNGGGKGEATCMLWLLCVHVDISTVYLMRGANAGAGGFRQCAGATLYFEGCMTQHNLIAKTMLTWI